MKERVLDLMNYCFPELECDNIYDTTHHMDRIHVLDHAAVVKKKYHMNYHGNIIQVNGLSRVVIEPTHRGIGLGKKLMVSVLEKAYGEGDVLSILHPFLHKYYQKHGYVKTYERLKYRMSIDALEDINASVDYAVGYSDDLTELRRRFFKRYHGSLDVPFESSDKKHFIESRGYSICKVFNDSAKGYLIYRIEDNHMNIHEISWDDLDIYKGIMRFIYGHRSTLETFEMNVPLDDPLRHLINEPNRRVIIQPDMMSRVVNVHKALSQMNVEADTGLIIGIRDSLIEENNGSFLIATKGAKRVDEKPQVVMDISTFTLLFMGKLEQALIHFQENDKRLLEATFKSCPTYMNEVF